MKTITVTELHKLLSSGEAIDLIDVRTPAEYAAVHVAEARLEQLDGLDCGALIASKKAGTHSPIYILCHSGVRAKKAATRFAETGFEETVVVEGGTQAWVDAGLPVVREKSSVLPLDRQLQITIGTLVVIGVLLARFVNPNWIWLSGFVGLGLIVAGCTGVCLMRSLIALMPWNQRRGGGNCCGGSCCS
ncbi:MAG: rhodanese-like domain-containing protein [Chthoniobacteraceae bacterium]